MEYIDFGDKIHPCRYCGALFWLSERLKKTSKNNPKFNLCCLGGKIKLPNPLPTPPYLDFLLDPSNGPMSQNFRKNIRYYNSMFAFTSMGAQVDKKINNGIGPYVFKISGQVHHLMGSLLPFENENPKFAQLYVHDTCNELQNRLSALNYDPHIDTSIDTDVVHHLITMLDETNELVKAFRLARDRIQQSPIPSVKLRLVAKRSGDGRQYDDCISNNIAGLIVGDIGEFHSERDIIVEDKNKNLQRITKLHPKYMSLAYPLLFPYGEDGYRPDLKWNVNFTGHYPKQERIPMRAYYAYQIQERIDEDNTLLKGGRLYQQFLVDAYATLEEDRLDYIRMNQKNLRSELYKGIHEAINRGDTNANDVGKKKIIPASYTGSARYMFNNYQDALAICRQFGFPNLFITFTSNVNWPEVTRELSKKTKYTPEEKADIISRVFKFKLDHMVEYIKSGKPFGDIIADLGTIEFQKRGLPHVHILIWFHDRYKCITAEDVDSIISAELPSKQTHPAAHEVVAQFMMHGPCGIVNPDSPCMKSGKCSKFFPKPFRSETLIEQNGYTYYKRRDNPENFVLRNGVKLDNGYVVPYNTELLLRYQAHINVVICCQSMLIKYLFKYINKGTDRARIAIGGKEFDEIEAYLNCRFICPYEAAWRLFQFPIHFREPSVERLIIHLPLEQPIVFESSENLNFVLRRKKSNQLC